MARYVTGTSHAAYGQGLLGSLSSSTMGYLQNEISRLSFGGDFKKALYERSMKLYDAISSTTAFQVADAVLMQAESAMGQDIIEELLTVVAMQTAKPVMQGWIMETPYIREQWQAGKLEGFSDTYVDPEPGVEGEAREAYQKLWHGVYRPHETQAHTASYYAGREVNDALELPVRRLAAILRTQEEAEWLLKTGEDDITSQYGAKL